MIDLETVSAYVDGDLQPGERARFEAALKEDPSLLEAVEEVRTLRALAHQAVPAGPARDLWPAIRDRVRRPLFSTVLFRWGPIGAVATAAILGAFVLVGRVLGPSDGGLDDELATARDAYVSVVGRLESTARTRATRLSPAVRAKVNASLAAVDRAIAECEQALARDLDHDLSRHHFLLALYDEKVRVLKTVIEATDKPKPQGRVDPPRGFSGQETT